MKTLVDLATALCLAGLCGWLVAAIRSAWRQRRELEREIRRRNATFGRWE